MCAQAIFSQDEQLSQQTKMKCGMMQDITRPQMEPGTINNNPFRTIINFFLDCKRFDLEWPTTVTLDAIFLSKPRCSKLNHRQPTAIFLEGVPFLSFSLNTPSRALGENEYPHQLFPISVVQLTAISISNTLSVAAGCSHSWFQRRQHNWCDRSRYILLHVECVYPEFKDSCSSRSQLQFGT